LSGSSRKSFSRILVLGLRELIAATLWIFAFTKLFVYDVDQFFVDRFAPVLYPLLEYRFFLLVAFIAFSWLTLGNRRFRIIVAYVLFYPLVILLWRIPKLAVRNWATAIVFAPAIESFVTTFKVRFIAGSFAMLAALGIATISEQYVLVAAMIVLFLYLCAHYVLRLRVAFQPSIVLADISLLGDVWKRILSDLKTKETQDTAGLDPSSDEFGKKHIANLRRLVFYNLMCTSVAKKLKEVVSSHKTDLYFLGALAYTFVLTVVIFSFEYFALYKIQPTSFSTVGTVSFLTLLVFSFNTILTAELATVAPADTTAVVFANLELLAGLIIFVILLFVILTSKRERYRQDMTNLIEQLDTGAQKFAGFMETEFKVSLSEAQEKIESEQPEFSKAIDLLGGRATPSDVKSPEGGVGQRKTTEDTESPPETE